MGGHSIRNFTCWPFCLCPNSWYLSLCWLVVATLTRTFPTGKFEMEELLHTWFVVSRWACEKLQATHRHCSPWRLILMSAFIDLCNTVSSVCTETKNYHQWRWFSREMCSEFLTRGASPCHSCSRERSFSLLGLLTLCSRHSDKEEGSLEISSMWAPRHDGEEKGVEVCWLVLEQKKEGGRGQYWGPSGCRRHGLLQTPGWEEELRWVLAPSLFSSCRTCLTIRGSSIAARQERLGRKGAE